MHRRANALRPSAVPQKSKRETPNFSSVGRKKNAAEFEEPHAFRARAEIARERAKQTGKQTRPQRDMVFAQRIAQLERFPDKARA